MGARRRSTRAPSGGRRALADRLAAPSLALAACVARTCFSRAADAPAVVAGAVPVDVAARTSQRLPDLFPDHARAPRRARAARATLDVLRAGPGDAIHARVSGAAHPRHLPRRAGRRWRDRVRVHPSSDRERAEAGREADDRERHTNHLRRALGAPHIVSHTKSRSSSTVLSLPSAALTVSAVSRCAAMESALAACASSMSATRTSPIAMIASPA